MLDFATNSWRRITSNVFILMFHSWPGSKHRKVINYKHCYCTTAWHFMCQKMMCLLQICQIYEFIANFKISIDLLIPKWQQQYASAMFSIIDRISCECDIQNESNSWVWSFSYSSVHLTYWLLNSRKNRIEIFKNETNKMLRTCWLASVEIYSIRIHAGTM